MKKTQVLILGGTGMLGHTLLRHLARVPAVEVKATVRKLDPGNMLFPQQLHSKLVTEIDAACPDTIRDYLDSNQPDLVINCIGLVKQIQNQQTPTAMIGINAVLPHWLACYCSRTNARLVHISTDCVFSGNRGNYRETDPPDPEDLYGITKQLGEIRYPKCLTLRTSIIGHELRGRHGLVEWFLAQSGTVKGYTRAIYSGLPTIELARFIADYVLPDPKLEGLYQLTSEPISKFELLNLIRQKYALPIQIEPDEQVKCDHSMDSSLLRRLTGYQPPTWSELVDRMYQDYQTYATYCTT